jgi:hypothetical protein
MAVRRGLVSGARLILTSSLRCMPTWRLGHERPLRGNRPHWADDRSWPQAD